MEDGLDVYHRDYADHEVLICLDETSKQQTRETRTPLSTRPGQPAADDFEYERNGTANLFMLCAPLIGWRHVEVTDRRTRQDFAAILRMFTSPARPLFSSWIISTPTSSRRSTTASRRPRPSGSRIASRFIIRQNMAVGSISPTSRSMSCPGNASRTAFPTGRRWSGKSPPGKTNATPTQDPSTGGLQQKTPASN